LLLATTALLSVPAVYAADLGAESVHEWTGLYLGASAGATQNQGRADFEYGGTSISDSNWSGGWDENGHYIGALYEDVDTSYLDTDTDSQDFALDLLESWVDKADSEDLALSGSLYLGAQVQWDALVFGAEVRGTFSPFGASYADQWNDQVVDGETVDCDLEPDANCFTSIESYNDWDATWEGTNGGYTNDEESSGGTTWVRNDWEMAAATSYDTMLSGLVRTGIAVDRVMVYGTGGVTAAEVTAKTNAHVLETGFLTAQTDYGTGIALSGVDEVTWSGTNTEQLVGYSLGAGFEFAMSEHMNLRGEALYTDLGDIDVTASSLDTDATYTVSQSVRNLQISAGIVTLF
jgi:outer membrane immunogenic protein